MKILIRNKSNAKYGGHAYLRETVSFSDRIKNVLRRLKTIVLYFIEKKQVKKMIVVIIKGGLGNQLFQYAYYLLIRKLNPKENICIRSRGIDHNGYELETDFDHLIISKISGFHCFIERVIKKFIEVSGIFINRDEFIYRIPGICMYLDGCWQRLSAVSQVEDELRSLQFIPFTEEANLQMNAYLQTTNQTVALHVRRGDYLNYKDLYCVLGETTYYERAIQYMRGKLGSPMFIVFSDDMDWCREHLPLDVTACYVDWNRGENSFRDMQLMSLCKHMITANSTFSWWGAWLNTNPDKIVVTPGKWFVDGPTEAIIDIPKDWVRI